MIKTQEAIRLHSTNRKNLFVSAPIAVAKIPKSCFPFLQPNPPLHHLPEFQVAADSLEAPVVTDRRRGLY